MDHGVEHRWPHRALILACAIIAALPLVLRGNSCGHDFDFHVQSWLAVSQSWHEGAFYPHWVEYANYSAGEPRLVFYPPISWMLGAFLGLILPWAATPAAFTLIILIACGLSMSKLANEWLPARAATAAACAYILNPYALFVAYERTAYAELAAGVWLPLMLLYVLRDGTRAGASRVGSATWVSPQASVPAGPITLGTRGSAREFFPLLTWVYSTIPLALTIAAIWLTNAPAAVMACYTLAAVTLWKALARKRWQPILHSIIGLVLGLGLAAFYLVPAAYERRWVDIARAVGSGMRVEDSFLFEHTGQAFHDQVLHTASWIFVTMLATVAICAWIARRRKAASSFALPACGAAALLLAFQLPFSDRLWRLAPELSFLQFPWRWSLVLSIVFGFSIGAAVVSSLNSHTKLRSCSVIILIGRHSPLCNGKLFLLADLRRRRRRLRAGCRLPGRNRL